MSHTRAPKQVVGDPDAPRSGFRIIIDPQFGRLFFGKLISVGGAWMHNITAAILTFHLTGSAFMVGLVSVVQFAPQLMFSMWSGAIADRGNHKRQLLTGRLMAAAGSGGLAAWLLFRGSDSGGAAPVILAAVVLGLGQVIGGPAMQAMVPSLVRPSELSTAIALDSVPMIAARTLGPIAGAFIVTQFSPATAFTVAAFGHLTFTVLIVGLKVPVMVKPKAGTEMSVRAGLRHLRVDPPLILLLVGAAAVSIGADPSITLTPTIAHTLGGGSSLVGWFASAFGAGAAIGVVSISRARRWLGLARLGTLGLALMAAGTGLLAVSRNETAVVAAFLVAGLGMSWGMTSFRTQILARLPEHLRGRIMALWLIAFVGSRPLAAAWNGAIADVVSVEFVLILDGIALLGAAVLCRPSRVRSSHRSQDTDEVALESIREISEQ